MHRVMSAVAVLLVAGGAACATQPAQVGSTTAAGEILFTRRLKDGGRPDLYVMAASGSRVRLFLRNAAEAAVSADGRRVAFVRDGAIWVAGRDGAGRRRLTTGRGRPAKGVRDFSPAWSPDGTTVYFSRLEANGEEGSVFSIRTDGTRLRRLAGPVGKWEAWCADDPAPSPNGRVVAYGATDCLHGAPGGIDAVDVRTRQPRPILEHFPNERKGWKLWLYDPAWSPDGGRIALAELDPSGEDPDRSGIWIARADGSKARRVWDASRSVPGIPWRSGWPSAPAWSSDGRWLAFGSDVVLPSWYPGEIVVVRPDGSGLRSVTRTRTIDERGPVWLNAD